ncbi:hypothetical protein LG3211_2303 [Lysobacter gummosus]|nr:hypothetical protein LG3211_2303 [Lysobacter gummosus]
MEVGAQGLGGGTRSEKREHRSEECDPGSRMRLRGLRAGLQVSLDIKIRAGPGKN